MASPVRTDAQDRNPQATTSGSSVQGETSDQAGNYQPLLVCPTPEVESDPTRLGQLLPLLHRSGPALCVARPLCRRPSVALAYEEAWQPPPEKVDDSAIAESGPSHPDGLARKSELSSSSLPVSGSSGSGGAGGRLLRSSSFPESPV